jgi:formylglycine-generating enzyme required for sulfatase activity
MSKLALVRSRSASLSDLSDLKELARLEELSEDLISKHFPGGDPLEITRAKWSELQDWMNGVDRLEKEVQQACAVVPGFEAGLLPSKVELETRQRKLGEFAAALSGRLNDHVSRLPADAVSGGVVLPELAEHAQLEDLTAGKQASRVDAFADRCCLVNAGLANSVKSSMAKLRQLQELHSEHEKHLQNLSKQLEEGSLSEAENTAESLRTARFTELNYTSLSEVETWRSTRWALIAAKRGNANRLIASIKKTYPNASKQSELGQLLERHQKRASAEKTKVLVLAVVLIGLVSGFAKVMVDNHREELRIAAEAKAKAEAERSELPKKIQVTTAGAQLNVLLTDALAQSFALVPSGSFTMGSSSNEEGASSDESQVEVTVSQSFWLAKTELTQAQWVAVMGSNPSEFKGLNLPVENVSWEDAQAFIAKLNEKQILPQGWKFALPSEAQWEYACRAGEKGPYSGGSLDEVGWYDGNGGSRTHGVVQKKPNALGLYDMHGNVYEWCSDWYEDTLKGGIDPVGPASGDRRVGRGGSWYVDASRCRAAFRAGFVPGYRNYDLGLRPALVPSGK